MFAYKLIRKITTTKCPQWKENLSIWLPAPTGGKKRKKTGPRKDPPFLLKKEAWLKRCPATLLASTPLVTRFTSVCRENPVILNSWKRWTSTRNTRKRNSPNQGKKGNDHKHQELPKNNKKRRPKMLLLTFASSGTQLFVLHGVSPLRLFRF